MTRNEKYIKFNRELSQIESIFRLNKSSCWACAQDYEKTVSGLLSAFKHYTHFKTESEWVRVNTTPLNANLTISALSLMN